MADERDKVMIFRKLPTGCDNCGLSLNYCSAVRDLERRPCCDGCSHS